MAVNTYYFDGSGNPITQWTDWKFPNATSNVFTNLTNPTNAYVSNNTYATNPATTGLSVLVGLTLGDASGVATPNGTESFSTLTLLPADYAGLTTQDIVESSGAWLYVYDNTNDIADLYYVGMNFSEVPLDATVDQIQLRVEHRFDGSTYYVDSVSQRLQYTTPSVSDPLNNWANKTNAFDGNSTTLASASSNTDLNGLGTNAPLTGDTITQVRARIKRSSAGFEEWVTLNTPTGGWTWSGVSNLESATSYIGSANSYISTGFYEVGDLGGTELGRVGEETSTETNQLYLIEIEVISGDSPLVLDSYPLSNWNGTDFNSIRSGEAYIHQKMTAAATADLSSATYYLERRGSPTGLVYVKLYTYTVDEESMDLNSPLAISDGIDVTTIGTTFELVDFTFSNPKYEVQEGTNYLISLFYEGGSVFNDIKTARTLSGEEEDIFYAYGTPPVVYPKLETLVDNFNNNTKDTVEFGEYSDAAVYLIAEAGQRIANSHVSEGASRISTYYSLQNYSFDETYFSVEVEPMLGDDSWNNWISIFGLGATEDAVQFRIFGSTLQCYKKDNGANSVLTGIIYNATNHRFLRFREVSGITYWEASPDGLNWSILASTASWGDFSLCYPEFQLLSNSFATGAGYQYIDNLNVGKATITESVTYSIKTEETLNRDLGYTVASASTVPAVEAVYTYNGSSFVDTHTINGIDGSLGNMVVVAVANRNVAAEVASVTIGGVTATRTGAAVVTDVCGVEFFWVYKTDFTSNLDVVISTPSFKLASATVWVVSNADNVPIEVQNVTDTQFSSDASIDVTTISNNALVLGATNRQGVGTFTPVTNTIEDSDFNNSNGSLGQMTGFHRGGEPAGIKTVGATLSESDNWATSVIAIKQVIVGTCIPGWTHKTTVTVQSSQIDAELTDFPVGVNLADLDATFWANVKSDGSDIRVTLGGTSIEIPAEVSNFDDSTNTGTIYFKAPTLSATVNTTFNIQIGNAFAATPAPTDPNGRNNVWTNHEIVAHLDTVPTATLTDSTGNGSFGTTMGSMTTSDLVAAPLGKAINLDGVDDGINFGDTGIMGLSDMTLTILYRFEAGSGRALIAKSFYNANDGRYALLLEEDAYGDSATVLFDSGNNYNGVYNVETYNNAGDWHVAHIVFDRDANSLLYIDGNLIGTTDISPGSTFDFNVGNNLYLGQYNDGAGTGVTAGESLEFKGDMGSFRNQLRTRSAEWIKAESVNILTPSTFYTASATTTCVDSVTETTTRDISYAVVTTPADRTKDLEYQTVDFDSSEKTLAYKIINAAETVTRDTEYQVVSDGLVTKDAQYAVVTTPPTKTRSAEYAVTKAGTETNNLSYEVLNFDANTKTAAYSVLTDGLNNQQAEYRVITEGTETRNASYKVTSFNTVTKDTEYQVVDLQAETKSAAYAVSTENTKTRNLGYAIAVTEVTLCTDFFVIEFGSLTFTETRESKYTVDTTKSVTKDLEYNIGFFDSLQKQLGYEVVKAIDVPQDLVYTVESTQTETRDISYNLGAIITLANEVAYTVITESTKSKQSEYTIEKTITDTRAIEYIIVKEAGITKSTQYTLETSVSDTKEVDYFLVRTGTEIKSSDYSILTDSTLSREAEYAIETKVALPLPLQYTIETTVLDTKDVDYFIILTSILEKNLRYHLNSSPTLPKHKPRGSQVILRPRGVVKNNPGQPFSGVRYEQRASGSMKQMNIRVGKIRFNNNKTGGSV